jgi:hypothetical protein
MQLEDFSKIDLIIILREYLQFAYLLVHDGRVLVEGPTIALEYFNYYHVVHALFNTVAAEVDLFIARKKRSGQRWIGDGKVGDLWEVD